MAPSNDSVNSVLSPVKPNKDFVLSDGNLYVKGVHLLSQVPANVRLKTFSSSLLLCKKQYSDDDIPPDLYHRVYSNSQNACFLGFTQHQPSHILTNSLGKFTTDRDFLSIFRFKTWWTTQWIGRSGSDLQKETQWVLLDVPEIKSYVLIVPIIEPKFRSALHPGDNGHVMITVESGSSKVKAASFDRIAYVHVSDNPFNLMKEAYSALRVYLNTFRLLEEKSLPPIIDRFGWCTWDAFYLTVEPAGVWHGVQELSEGGLSPRFIIIDDGWQSINLDGENPNEDAKNLVLGGTQMTARLHRLDEGEKFRNYTGGSLLGPNPPPFHPEKPKKLINKAIELEQAEKARDQAVQSGSNKDLIQFETKIERLKQELNEMFSVGHESDSTTTCGSEDHGMKAFTRDLRTRFKGLDDIYVWHSVCGAWGGVRPGTTHLNSSIIPCKVSPGLDGTMHDLAVVKIVEGGIGLVHPNQAHELYDSMHSYLSDAGITGVKVDVIHEIEYVGEDHGGRVELAKAYYKGLSMSISKNFRGTGIIASMQQCNDFFFLGTQQIPMGRVGDDFWFQDPNGDPEGVYWLQGVHMIHCAYNSLWMGQIIQPDWDMFQSDHVCAKFHAGSRAICGGPVYVSDSLGGHDFGLLKMLVYPDGTIPRCQHFALPTRDCLFKNPLFDKTTILKIWNFNKYGGVVGAFNCQGAGWDPKEQRIKGYSHCYKPMTGSIHVCDIEWDQKKENVEGDEAEEYAVYMKQAEKLCLTTRLSEATKIRLEPLAWEVFSFVPVKKIGKGAAKFAPIGLTNMINSGGTIDRVEYKYNEGCVKIKVKGEGKLLAYSSVSPHKCCLNGSEVGFDWLDEEGGKLSLNIPWVEEAGGLSAVDFLFRVSSL